jgi:large subunit ribosomal protein L25
MKKLKVVPRSTEKKRETKRLQRAGSIPAVKYTRGAAGTPIAVEASEFDALLRGIAPGRLSTTVFSLADDKGKEFSAIVKDIQYNVTNYAVTHLDFEELTPDVAVDVKVPIECVGQSESVGVKLGGIFRQVIRYIKVRCLPKDIPTYFELDVRDLAVGQSKRLKDLPIPKTVRPLADLNEVAIVIAKR